MSTDPPPINTLLADATGNPNADTDGDTDTDVQPILTNTFDAQTQPERVSISQQLSFDSSIMASQHKSLVALPPELLNNIAGFLPTNDFNALRLTSKQLEDKLFPYWANCFFKKKQFMISQLSLQTLLDISRHPTLSKCMKHLIIGLDHLKAAKPQTMPNLEEYERFRRSLSSQDRLLDTGAAVDLLAKALADLPKLETIDIRDFNSASRYRDTHDTRARAASARVPEWRSYGHSEHRTWLRHLGAYLIDPYSPASANFVDRVFKIVLAALGRSTPSARSLEVLLRNPRVGLRDDAFAVFPALDPGIPTFLKGLTRLHLDVSPDPSRIMPSIWQPSIWQHPVTADVPLSASCSDPSTANIRRFLSLTPNVTWLRLNFSGESVYATASLLLRWLALRPDEPSAGGTNTTWSDANSEPIALPLKKLDLGNVNISPEVLAAVVRSFDQLEDLSLKRISLLSDASKYANEETDHGTPWPRFFRKLPDRAPNLKSLSLRNLRSGPLVARLEDVIFDDGTADADANFANRPRRFLHDLRDLETDQTGLERLAAMTWTISSFNKARSGQSPEDSAEEGSDGGGDGSDGDSDDDPFGEGEVDQFEEEEGEELGESDGDGAGDGDGDGDGDGSENVVGPVAHFLLHGL